MAKGFNGVALGQLRSLFDEGAVGGLSDGELLGRFLDDRDESALGVLLHRHGPLVFGICRRTLRDPHQTEDAFQATFLLLARKARSIRNREAVGPWLVGVAAKVAARAKGDAIRRRTNEGRAAELASAWSSTDSPDREELAVLLQEVDRLRRPLREAVVLCHLQGLTYVSAADALGVSEGSIRGRLARAREILRDRLGHLGLARDASALALLAPRMLEAAPARLIEPTIRASMAVAAGRAVPGFVPGSAITLMEGALKAMWIAKLKTTIIVASAIGLIGLGATVRVQARQKPEAGKAGETSKVAETTVDPTDLAAVVPGRIVRSAEVTKDCSILSYMPDWDFGNLDNLMLANNDGGVRTLVDWPDVPASEAKSADLKFYLAFYSRATTVRPKPGAILTFEVVDDWSGRTHIANKSWPERTSWKTRPYCGEEPVATTKFEPGEGWKLFDITAFVRDNEGRSGQGLMFRFYHEDRRSEGDWSGYYFVSREGKDQWAGRRPRLLVVESSKK
jgi:RNA polymerase sigma factor (sigma-70 family)